MRIPNQRDKCSKTGMRACNNECTKVSAEPSASARVHESLNACANAGKARAIEIQGWLCTLLEALLL